MEVILFFVLVYAAKKAWDDSKKGAAKSRQAYMARAAAKHPGMPRSRQVAHAVRHDAGHVLSQLLRGFPNARHGFAAGWHEGRQAHAHARAEHQRAKAEHLETQASLIPDLTAYRARQKAALEQIRQGAGPAVKASACRHAPGPCLTPTSCPCGCPDCMAAFNAQREPKEEGSEGSTPAVPMCWSCFVRDGDEHAAWCATRGPVWPDDTDGPTYSWGLVDAPRHWPAANREQAERQARAGSRDGRTHVVLEYPPGGGQGQIVAAFRDDKPFGRSPDDDEDAPLPGADDSDTDQDGEEFSPSPTTEGTPMASEVTYDGVIRQMSASVAAAEQQGADLTRSISAASDQAAEAAAAQREADQAAEQMQALKVDPATLGAMADYQDALGAAEKAHQAVLDALAVADKAQRRTLEAAQNVESTLKSGHAGLAEAHQNAPVQAAEREFYQD